MFVVTRTNGGQREWRNAKARVAGYNLFKPWPAVCVLRHIPQTRR